MVIDAVKCVLLIVVAYLALVGLAHLCVTVGRWFSSGGALGSSAGAPQAERAPSKRRASTKVQVFLKNIIRFFMTANLSFSNSNLISTFYNSSHSTQLGISS